MDGSDHFVFLIDHAPVRSIEALSKTRRCARSAGMKPKRSSLG
jgi:hypothetical protein